MELDITTEARRKAQRNGEEDPVVVAQRFLNIYRQIHIFNSEKKNSFNKMLLELSPEIRGMFGQLPGGALLQEYVDELAEQQGVEKAIVAPTAGIAEEDVKQAKILATALAEAQAQAGVAAPVVGAATTPASPANIKMGKEFAQEFAGVLSEALQKNSQSQNIELKSIVNALGRAQLDMLKVIQTENNNHREDIKNISKALQDSQQKMSAPQKISEETKQLIKILLTSQQQMMDRISKIELAAVDKNASNNKMLVAMLQQSERNYGKMLAVLNQRQKNDTLEVIKMINDSQKNMMQLMVQHNNNNQSSASNNNNININSADYSKVLNRIADKLDKLKLGGGGNVQLSFPQNAWEDLVSSQTKLYREVATEQTKELAHLITMAIKESRTPIYFAKEKIEENVELPHILPSADEVASTETEDNMVYESYKDYSHLSEDSVESQDNAQLTSIETEEQQELISEEDTPKKKKRKRKKKKKTENEEVEALPATPEVIESEDVMDVVSDQDVMPEDKEVSELENVFEQETSSLSNIWQDDTPEPEENTPINLFDAIGSDTADDWGFSVIEDIKEDETQEEAASEQDWEWVYEEDDKDLGEGTDWVWEYVSDDEENSSQVSFHSSNLQPLGKDSLISSGNLFFQNAVYKAQPIANRGVPSQFSVLPGIYDSSTEDELSDPYQNSGPKD
ncbi:MAG: hypothetical protein E7018_05990 [Alphaproteobacteria bacterium]|nr:hypothetical protein [Alphaproteobacteria bacterium]